MKRLKQAYSKCMSCGGKMKKGGKWIQSAIKKPGSFTAQAKRAGMSVAEFRKEVLANKDKYSATTVRRANLAKTLSKMKKGEAGMMVPRVNGTVISTDTKKYSMGGKKYKMGGKTYMKAGGKFVVRPCSNPGTPFAVWQTSPGGTSDKRIKGFKTKAQASEFASSKNK